MILLKNIETGKERVVENGTRYLLPWKAIRSIPIPKPTPDGKFGLGDLIAALLTIIGIHKKKGCGCNKRQNRWNKYKIKLPDWIIKLIRRGLAWHS